MIAFIDSEIGGEKFSHIQDLGALLDSGQEFHSANLLDFAVFVEKSSFLCGHNIVAHDLKHLAPHLHHTYKAIDTLPLSPLLFPKRYYHALVKDDKLQSDELNNPLNDARQAQKLFYDEVNAFRALPHHMQRIFTALLYPFPQFQGFFDYLHYKPYPLTERHIQESFADSICAHAPIGEMMRRYPVELCYALALISTHDHLSVTPPWVMHQYPEVENVMRLLRNTPCREGCPYCRDRFDAPKALKRYFGFDAFRTYDGEPLQQRAAEAALQGDSLLAIFPTGGGKSLTFQLPALVAGEAFHGLTVVISPLQSLMKDQVDNLEERGIVGAVTVNGLLSPIERADALRSVEDGTASLLYISPEQLRSATIQRLLLKRNIARFVIDEAHCFSSWGQDFRVDYLYIGDFIRTLQEQKSLNGTPQRIPVSCFTATAKQKVISDILDYFQRTLSLQLRLFSTTAARENLRYHVIHCDTDQQKYTTLRTLLDSHPCPAIVYVSRTRRSRELADRLCADGFRALPFNGKMERNEKVANQDSFMRDETQIIVATSAFGMGVDKKDVGLVVHYNISDSLENYIQEAGRAGRDPGLQADCYVLFNDEDLDKHFILLNQTKISLSEIQQVWRAVKELTRVRPRVSCSPLEIARQAGWDHSLPEIETRVKTAVAALEQAGYLRRGRNMPHVYATSILAHNMQEAVEAIQRSHLFNEAQTQNATRIVKSLISCRSRANAGNDEAESRVDYLADLLGIPKQEVIESVNLMRQAHVLSDAQDMSAFIHCSDNSNRSSLILNQHLKYEQFLLSLLQKGDTTFDLKAVNDQAIASGVPRATIARLKTLLFFWHTKGLVLRGDSSGDKQHSLLPQYTPEQMADKLALRSSLCHFIVENLFRRAGNTQDKEMTSVDFSLHGLWQEYTQQQQSLLAPVSLSDVEEALLYLSKIGALRLEGGFLVIYNAMEINRLVLDPNIKYKKSDYRQLDEFYRMRMQQIHIVGEFANLMVRDYDAALRYVGDYFQMDFRAFISRYFKGDRQQDIRRNITPQKYHRLFSGLSPRQLEIIQDDTSPHIVVAAGPGSGKTRILVHKLASLLQLEDVKHEQLLMLTFSRAAATEFKQRLRDLIGNAANYIEIKTFHSYCFDLLGKLGSLEEAHNVVATAAERIARGDVEPNRITKTVLVIDEAQDMDADEYRLVEALMQRNEGMRVIAVGDDDQNIYAFRGSDSSHMARLIAHHHATLYEMVDNYRSAPTIVSLANTLAATLANRMKSSPIQAVSQQDGHLSLTRHLSPHQEQPLVDQLLRHAYPGTTCVLTTTNAEALSVCGLLNRHGQRARLIQSNDQFSLLDLAEIRYFLKHLRASGDPITLSPATWNTARQRLADAYSKSLDLPSCLRLIDTFADLNPTRYLNDFEEYVRESQFEDFVSADADTVLVSTIHKAKGREFDNVYLLLGEQAGLDNDSRRALYVGITRAKRNLHLHLRTPLFPQAQEDPTPYPAPQEITLQLTHRDVHLDAFQGLKPQILSLRSGQELTISPGALNREGLPSPLIRLSQRFQKQLADLAQQGYTPATATIRHILFWQGTNTPAPLAIILPLLTLRRRETPS